MMKSLNFFHSINNYIYGSLRRWPNWRTHVMYEGECEVRLTAVLEYINLIKQLKECYKAPTIYQSYSR